MSKLLGASSYYSGFGDPGQIYTYPNQVKIKVTYSLGGLNILTAKDTSLNVDLKRGENNTSILGYAESNTFIEIKSTDTNLGLFKDRVSTLKMSVSNPLYTKPSSGSIDVPLGTAGYYTASFGEETDLNNHQFALTGD